MRRAIIKYIKDTKLETCVSELLSEETILEVINRFYNEIGNYEIRSVVIKNYV